MNPFSRPPRSRVRSARPPGRGRAYHPTTKGRTMNGEFTIEERIRLLLGQARAAEARGEAHVARWLRARADDLGPAPAGRPSR